MKFDHIPTNLLVREGPGYRFKDSVSLQAIGENEGRRGARSPCGKNKRKTAKIACQGSSDEDVQCSDSPNALKLVRGG